MRSSPQAERLFSRSKPKNRPTLERRPQDQLVVCFVNRFDEILGYVSTNKLYTKRIDRAYLVDAAVYGAGSIVQSLRRAASVLAAWPSPIAEDTRDITIAVLGRWSTAVQRGSYRYEIADQLGI